MHRALTRKGHQDSLQLPAALGYLKYVRKKNHLNISGKKTKPNQNNKKTYTHTKSTTTTTKNPKPNQNKENLVNISHTRWLCGLMHPCLASSLALPHVWPQCRGPLGLSASVHNFLRLFITSPGYYFLLHKAWREFVELPKTNAPAPANISYLFILYGTDLLLLKPPGTFCSHQKWEGYFATVAY